MAIAPWRLGWFTYWPDQVVVMQREKANAQRLIDNAFAALKANDSQRAIKIGKQLKKIRHSSAFEILALAYEAVDRLEDAVLVLEEGIQVAPSVWLLWQLLGNFYSDQQRYQESLACYQRALECPCVDSSYIHLNLALVFSRTKQWEVALNQLPNVTSDALQFPAKVLRMKLLNVLGRFEETQALKADAEALSVSYPEKERPEVARMYAYLGEAVWESRRDSAAALDYAWKSIAGNRNDPTALWLIRAVLNDVSPNAHYMNVIVEGEWSVPFEGQTKPHGFFVVYVVVADTPEEALNLIKPFEPSEVRASLAVDEYKTLEPSPTELKGVYSSSSYIFSPPESSS